MVFAADEGIGTMPAHPRSGSGSWSLGASFVVHLAIGLALLLVVAPNKQVLAPEDGVTVDVLTPQEFDAANGPSVAETPVQKPAEASVPPQAEQETPDFAELPTDRPKNKAAGMIRATRLMSAKVLADPRSAKARKAMKELVASERIVQLCNIEAMEQIHVWKAGLQPDFIVAYAMADVALSGNRLEAAGAAFRSKSRWYNVGFTCEVTPDTEKVTAFAFLVGAEIPKSEWRDHNLMADDGPAD
ncbi:DUF930 domain-containing protein [Rhizobium herbae]|uniref:DUF930 domain-containing protein n=1 Tax=Rhizobium herbae TaxID=508661 RepID=A0ABS4ELV9_9HYPH|nr:DUF930 domain-containing protein [Rhizobium herbae]MBP1858940.1 hypothetical protein [Rhizobium herbae]